LGLALDVPKDNDTISTVEGMEFYIDRGILPYVEDVHIDYEKSFWGSGVTIRAGNGRGC
jgi:Fe-S cluster assembly iron-binding protein IscA